jgi:membrane protein involved in colicin uptake
VNGVALLNGGAYVGPRVEGGSLPALTVNGVTASKGIHNGGQKISGVADGNVDAASDQAVNGSQLHETNEALALEKSERISGDAANAAGLAAEITAREEADTANAAAIAAEATTRANADVALSSRITAEATARAAADTANANAATAQIAASEARSITASRQSGALAMAVAGMTGASPTDHGRTAISMGVGTFGGETALAVGVSHAVTDAVRIFGSVTKVSGGDTGAAIGGSYSF